MIATIERLPRAWFTSGHDELWGCDSTYCSVSYDLLPDVSDVSSDFEWLNDFPDAFWGHSTLASDENNIAHFEKIVDLIHDHGLTLPAEFVRFMENHALHAKVPTCTACYLELSEALISLPWDGPCYALRFMNDSQCCILWYLILKREMPTRVVASPYFFDRDIFDVMNDEEEPMEYREVFENSFLCAESFLEFIYRFWIENAIWFSHRDQRQLSRRESEYVRCTAKKP